MKSPDIGERWLTVNRTELHNMCRNDIHIVVAEITLDGQDVWIPILLPSGITYYGYFNSFSLRSAGFQ